VGDPLHQFEIFPILQIIIGGIDLSFTNSAFWMLVTVLIVYWLVMAGTSRRALVPGRLQNVVELTYEFTAGMIRDSAGHEGMRYFPWIFTLFTYILVGNLVSMLPFPGHFTFTAHIIVTFALALGVFIGVTVLGFVLHGPRFLGFFVPHGAPKLMLPLLVPIEVLSYFVRPISLSIRLFVNMMAGHVLWVVFAGFSIAMGWFFGIGPLVLNALVTGFEIVVCFLQAYIFTVLTCLYLNDAIHMH
jgi:F-type H+-transporting ATPase subunit a